MYACGMWGLFELLLELPPSCCVCGAMLKCLCHWSTVAWSDDATVIEFCHSFVEGSSGLQQKDVDQVWSIVVNGVVSPMLSGMHVARWLLTCLYTVLNGCFDVIAQCLARALLLLVAFSCCACVYSCSCISI
jgi:hypothetical protein